MEKPLYYEPFMAYTPMDHRLFKEKFIDNSDLVADDILLLHEGHCFRNSVINLCNSLFDKNNKTGVKLESGSFETLIKLSQQGFGMTLVPYLKALELKNIEPEGTVKPFSRPQPLREISIIHHRTHLKISIIDALAKCIQENIPEHMLKDTEGEVISPN